MNRCFEHTRDQRFGPNRPRKLWSNEKNGFSGCLESLVQTHLDDNEPRYFLALPPRHPGERGRVKSRKYEGNNFNTQEDQGKGFSEKPKRGSSGWGVLVPRTIPHLNGYMNPRRPAPYCAQFGPDLCRLRTTAKG